MSTDLHQIAALRVVGESQRYTSMRRQLVDLLNSAEHPITIPDILRLKPDLAQSSVYRNLAVLEQAGVISRIVTHDEWARFELAEDIGGHHHHLICEECGTVRDVVVPDHVESALDESLGNLATINGFELRHHRLDLVGICAACRCGRDTMSREQQS
jgi:Fur family ferric uptake transcriptional regulator